MATLAVFKSTIPNISFVFGNGKPAVFQGGYFYTDIEAEISALKYEIAQGHPHIFIDEKEAVIESEMRDPLVALKAKLRAEIMAEEAAKLAAATDPTRDMGKSDTSSVKPASTQDIAAGAAGGSGAQLVARLSDLKITK